MATTVTAMTAQQLLETAGLGRCELIQGELVHMAPAGFEHGRIEFRLAARMERFAEENALGVVVGGEAGFLIETDPDTVRAPDIAFVRAERVPTEPHPGFFAGAPDLAVEVVSPGDRASEVLAKVRDWLRAGCRLVWVADPATRTVCVYRPGGRSNLLSVGEDLSGEDVLPGFRLPIAEAFRS
jgi:Uma2 family endonuclease